MNLYDEEDNYEDEFEASPDFQALITEHVAMVENSWNLLIQKGYVPGQKLAVDYVFVAQKRDKAKRLKAFLETHEGHQVKLVNNDDEFEISGKTEPMELSYEILQAWVEKMVTVGADYECTFDGWTTELAAKRKTSK